MNGGARRTIAIAIAAVLAGEAVAGPTKVMVLPLDGTADAATRAKYTASVQRLARVLDAKVSPGTTSFNDSATVIGCDPAQAACADNVRATLGVDELVYGSVSAQNGQLVVVVRRVAKGKPAREVTATIADKDSPERAEGAILPLFQAVSTAPPPPPPEKSGDDTVIVEDEDPNAAATTAETPEPSGATMSEPGDLPLVDKPRTRWQRTAGFAAIAGGGTMMLIGFALWSSASGVQDQIDAAMPSERDDFDDVLALEDKASSRAWGGNAMVFLGVGLGAFGGWLLYRDHKAQRMVVTPTPVGDGVGVTFTLRGGL